MTWHPACVTGRTSPACRLEAGSLTAWAGADCRQPDARPAAGLKRQFAGVALSVFATGAMATARLK